MSIQTLPPSFVWDLQVLQYSHSGSKLIPNYIVALRNRGWTLDSIGVPLGLSRERVRQLALKADPDWDDSVVAYWPEFEKVPVAKEPKAAKPVPTPKNLARMLELQPFAQQVRANSPQYREEGEEYTQLLDFEHTDRGVSLYRLAQDLGVTPGGLRHRLVRYGYKETKSESRVYTKVLDKNRVI